MKFSSRLSREAIPLDVQFKKTMLDYEGGEGEAEGDTPLSLPPQQMKRTIIKFKISMKICIKYMIISFKTNYLELDINL